MAKKKTAKKSKRSTAKKSAPAKKSKKSTAKKSAPAKKTRTPIAKAKTATKKKKPRAVSDVLSLEERAKLLKPRTDFLDVIGRVTREWQNYRALRVPGLSAAKLASLAKKAARASEKEEAVAEAMQRKLVPLKDARRVAHDAAYRALLDTHAAIKLHARLDAGVVERFAFVTDLVRNQPAESDDGGGAPPPPGES